MDTIYCYEAHKSCQHCEYALKEFGQVYGCQLEEDEKAADEQAYIEYIMMLEEEAEMIANKKE